MVMLRTKRALADPNTDQHRMNALLPNLLMIDPSTMQNMFCENDKRSNTQAAEAIVAHIQGYMARRSYAKAKASIIQLQSVFRTYVVRKRYLATSSAAARKAGIGGKVSDNVALIDGIITDGEAIDS
eukprot:CAMPEP_0178537698 /NCGR_PEP_ID=MMETSP0696-20121128/36726_1 /TAXON_ID=265572 /ORGANISM="Extubocellulus spinifer, Strain CCMP396" /LENGTH=126 /DNA_ID=CAMNT_0020169939 /DNA_START=585 /DNA_END=966 /DNA_ORIENTATION=+